MGPVRLRGYDLDQIQAFPVTSDGVEGELNRFRDALRASQTELERLKAKLQESLGPDEARIFDTHVAYLRDPIFIADVEGLIMKERMNLEAAVMKVIGDFDRIFQLVESDQIKTRAIDLRDVGIRVLRNLAPTEGPAPKPTQAPSGRYILAARQLSIVDMFNLENEQVEGIIAEEGGMTSHAAILARSMRIPTITGIAVRNLTFEVGTRARKTDSSRYLVWD
jgi:phosphotransferase system enzyme I (PtsI)